MSSRKYSNEYDPTIFTLESLRKSNSDDFLITNVLSSTPPTARLSGVLENLSNVYLGGRLCAGRQSTIVIEPVEPGAYYYRHCFAGRGALIRERKVQGSEALSAHHNYFGTDENLGPVAVSVIREKLSEAEMKQAGLLMNGIYRIIIRVSDVRVCKALAAQRNYRLDQSHTRVCARRDCC